MRHRTCYCYNSARIGGDTRKHSAILTRKAPTHETQLRTSGVRILIVFRSPKFDLTRMDDGPSSTLRRHGFIRRTITQGRDRIPAAWPGSDAADWHHFGFTLLTSRPMLRSACSAIGVAITIFSKLPAFLPVQRVSGDYLVGQIKLLPAKANGAGWRFVKFLGGAMRSGSALKRNQVTLLQNTRRTFVRELESFPFALCDTGRLWQAGPQP